MKKKLNIIFIALCVATAFAQAQTPATVPYSCNFENETENANWTLENGTESNKWNIGTATQNGGSKGLYISYDAKYEFSREPWDNSYVYAYRTITFDEIGEYVIDFDWKAGGFLNYNYARVFLVPNSITITAGMSKAVDYGLAGHAFFETPTPEGWITIDGQYHSQINWDTKTETVNILNKGNYNLVLFWKNIATSSYGTNQPIAVDNISIKKATSTATENISSTALKNAVAYYNLIGQKLSKEPTNGVYIIVYDNGTTEKVIK